MKKINISMFATAALSLGLVFVSPFAALADGPATVNLHSAGNFAVLTKAGISTTGTTMITGDIGVSPIGATAITGFGQSLPAGGAFSTSASVTGKIYASDYAVPTPTNLTTAISDMQTAYTDAAGRTNPTATELGAGNIGGLTLAPGLYKWSTGVLVPSNVTLSGSSNDVWIFQIAQTLTVSSGAHIILAGGAQANNIFWVVAGQTTIGTTAAMSGTILDQTGIVFNTGAILNGRAFAQTAVTLDSNTVTLSSGPVPTPTPTPTPVPTPTPAPTPILTPVPVIINNGNGNSGNNPPVVTLTPNASGCSSNNQFNTETGQRCMSFIQQSSTGMPSASAFGQAVKMLAHNLSKGSRGADVITLQQFLMSQNKGSAAQSLAAIGATGYFGEYTRLALAEFQAGKGLPSLGNFGPMTRAIINAQ